MDKKPLTVCVTGAAGQLGYATLARIAAGDMFGENQPVELQLLEAEPALPALEGIAMELNDMLSPVIYNIDLGKNPESAFRGTDWVIMIGGAARKPGQERKDVLQQNAQLYFNQGRMLNEVAGSNVRVLVVGNPCNTNCMVVSRAAPDIPKERFFAMTRLDENRARGMLAQRIGKSPDDIHGLAIWGNHSATQYPDALNAWMWMDDFKPYEIKLKDYLEPIDKQWVEVDFIPSVQERGAEVLKLRGASSAISAAQAIVDSVVGLTRPMYRDECHSFGVLSRGEYGIGEGLCFSYPVRSDGETWKVLEGVEHNELAWSHIRQSAAELIEEMAAVKHLFK